jgi:hypothetical protein
VKELRVASLGVRIWRISSSSSSSSSSATSSPLNSSTSFQPSKAFPSPSPSRALVSLFLRLGSRTRSARAIDSYPPFLAFAIPFVTPKNKSRASASNGGRGGRSGRGRGCLRVFDFEWFSFRFDDVATVRGDEEVVEVEASTGESSGEVG